MPNSWRFPIRSALARRTHASRCEPGRYTSFPHYHIAMAYAALGEKDAAFRCLRQYCDANEMWVSFIDIDPKMDDLC